MSKKSHKEILEQRARDDAILNKVYDAGERRHKYDRERVTIISQDTEKLLKRKNKAEDDLLNVHYYEEFNESNPDKSVSVPITLTDKKNFARSNRKKVVDVLRKYNLATVDEIENNLPNLAKSKNKTDRETAWLIQQNPDVRAIYRGGVINDILESERMLNKMEGKKINSQKIPVQAEKSYGEAMSAGAQNIGKAAAASGEGVIKVASDVTNYVKEFLGIK